MSFTLIPILFFYVIPVVFVVWSVLTIIKQQKENNQVLKEIIKVLKESK
ncbi:MAG TPA: hypothetical protein VK085_12385 [Pseudogracilibacillus sp.]|nr:hypothetical protein [Pseudogracilibacillus sp.]